MNNLVCPVSSARISENIPRINALLTILLLIAYGYNNSILIIPLFLAYDFFIRGFGNSKHSLLAIISKKMETFIPNKGKLIDKAPKTFAARLGFIFTILILVSQLLGLTTITYSLGIALILFASLECFLNFCVGCWVFTLFIQPFYKA
jgi:hypothetical protein